MRTKLSVLGAVLGSAPGLLPVIATLWALRPTVPAPSEPEVPVHPCELITVMKVPCDATSATCEYTYWECPQKVKPLRA
jgi:hypothetical protein